MAILFITSTRIGDAILSTGLLNRLLSDYPDDAVTIACGAPAAKVFEAVPGVERIHIIRKRSFSRHWPELWRTTLPRKWRILVDLRRSASPYIHRAHAKHVLPKTDKPMHRVELIAATLGLPPLAPKIWITDRHVSQAHEITGGGDDFLAMAPGANWPGKIWPAAHFVELAQRLLGPGGRLDGARLLLVGAEDERPAAQPLMDAFAGGRIVDAMGLDILSTYATLGHCRLFVGNDSAMMHLAAATGRPTVGLFGPTRDAHYAPWGDNGLVVRTPQSVEELIGHPGYDTRTTGTMMAKLSAETAEQAIRNRWPEALTT